MPSSGASSSEPACIIMASLTISAPPSMRLTSQAACLKSLHLGRRGYVEALALQEAAATRVAAGGADELLFVEHAAVITLGRGTRDGEVIVEEGSLRNRRVLVEQTDRGGRATFHGPGQLITYPIINLSRRGIGVRAYLRVLENVLVEVLAEQEIEAWTRSGFTGVWTESGKIAAIGIAVRRCITRHGLALNVDVDLSFFEFITPCGTREPVTSMQQMGWRGRTSHLQNTLEQQLAEQLDRESEVATRAIQAAGGQAATSVTRVS